MDYDGMAGLELTELDDTGNPIAGNENHPGRIWSLHSCWSFTPSRSQSEDGIE